MKAIIIFIAYCFIAISVFKKERFDKDGNYKMRGSVIEFCNLNESDILLGRITYLPGTWSFAALYI